MDWIDVLIYVLLSIAIICGGIFATVVILLLGIISIPLSIIGGVFWLISGIYKS